MKERKKEKNFHLHTIFEKKSCKVTSASTTATATPTIPTTSEK
jgi:hypothetical protein